MMTMKKIIISALLSVSLLGACGKSADDGKKPPAPVTSSKPASSAASSAPAAMKKVEGDDLAKVVLACVDAWNAHDAAKSGACYADDVKLHMVDSGMPDATGRAAASAVDAQFWKAFSDLKGQPQLVLVNGNHVVYTAIFTGTNDGEFMGKPATKKKSGVLGLVGWDMTDDGKVKESWVLVDLATTMGQLGLLPPIPQMAPRPVLEKGVDKPEIVIAKNDANEKANVDAIAKGTDMMMKGDYKGMLANSTDDMLNSDQVEPADVKGKANVEKAYTDMMKMFTSPKFESKARWGAGDYVFDAYTVDATAMGKPVHMTGANVFKFTGGKVSAVWGFGDKVAFMQQMGMIPAAPGAAPASSGAASSAAPAAPAASSKK
jgi:steroid delta-isomerase-like uncharacterized protein